MKINLKKIIANFLAVIYMIFFLSRPAFAITTNINNCEYVVDNMVFMQGDSICDNICDANFVSVDVTRRIQGSDDDLLIFAFYDEYNVFLGIETCSIKIALGVETTFKQPISTFKGSTLKMVKAFVWNSTGDIRPLSNSLSSENNMYINPSVETPQYAVLEKVELVDEVWVVSLIDEYGREKRYYINESATSVIRDSSFRLPEDSQNVVDSILDYVYADYENNIKNDIEKRVIRYTLSWIPSTISKIYFLLPEISVADGVLYNAGEKSLGDIKFGNNTVIICIDDYLEEGLLRRIAASYLYHNFEYTAVAYESSVNGEYSYVLLSTK